MGTTSYFGADRFTTNGTAQMGFWFFQQEVGQCTAANTATCGPVGTFGPGVHQVGDILVLSDFTQGGARQRPRLPVGWFGRLRWRARPDPRTRGRPVRLSRP